MKDSKLLNFLSSNGSKKGQVANLINENVFKTGILLFALAFVINILSSSFSTGIVSNILNNITQGLLNVVVQIPNVGLIFGAVLVFAAIGVIIAIVNRFRS